MTSKKITELTAAASLTSDDLILVVDDPNGTATTKKATVSTMQTYMSSALGISSISASVSTLSASVTTNSASISSIQSLKAAATVVHAARNQSATSVETFDRIHTQIATAAAVSGTVYFTYFTPLIDLTISKIGYTSGTTLASGGTLIRFGLYTVSGSTLTLVARTASNTSLFAAASTYYEQALNTTGGYPANYALVAGTRYAVAQVFVGTTPGTRIASSFLTAGQEGDGNTRLRASLAGQTDLPTSTSSQVFTGTFNIWGQLTA